MLPLFHEYTIEHPRFSEHARVAYVMSMVVPLCSIFIANAVGWWNPWLWSGSGIGIGLALALGALVNMHRSPARLSGPGRRFIQHSRRWFPYLFVIIQSATASLIVIFIWFSASSMALPMPVYAHAALLILALLIPARRFVSSHIQPGAPWKYEVWREILRGVWHALATVLITRILIGITIPDQEYVTQGRIAWQTLLWVPAAIYIVFSSASTLEQVRKIRSENAPAVASPTNPSKPADVL